MKKSYFAGAVSGLRDCLDARDPEREAQDYLDRYSCLPEGDDLRKTDLGFRMAMRQVRDHGLHDAIDHIAARLWKWGAETELDQLLALVGMNEREDHAHADLPVIVEYEKLSGEVILSYGEGGAA